MLLTLFSFSGQGKNNFSIPQVELRKTHLSPKSSVAAVGLDEVVSSPTDGILGESNLACKFRRAMIKRRPDEKGNAKSF